MLPRSFSHHQVSFSYSLIQPQLKGGPPRTRNTEWWVSMGNDEQEKDLDRSSGREHGEGGMVLEVLGTPGTEGVLAGLGWQRSRDPFSFLSRPFGLLPSQLESSPHWEREQCRGGHVWSSLTLSLLFHQRERVPGRE